MDRELPNTQTGFRKGTGTRDQIANICWIIEKARELKKNLLLMTQQSHCRAYTLRKPELKEARVPPMFIAALFIIARTWKQPRCPSADEWIRKLWYVYTMEYYSAIKKNTFESVLMRWMKLEPIIQSEVSQKEKHQYSILTHIYGI